jgi:plasmid stabilization system protein ParE
MRSKRGEPKARPVQPTGASRSGATREARWSRRATADLLDIGDFIAERNPAVARTWVERPRARAARAATSPRAARKVPELDRDDIREVFLKSYRMVYRILEEGIVVLTVVEGHRQLRQIEPESTE